MLSSLNAGRTLLVTGSIEALYSSLVIAEKEWLVKLSVKNPDLVLSLPAESNT